MAIDPYPPDSEGECIRFDARYQIVVKACRICRRYRTDKANGRMEHVAQFYRATDKVRAVLVEFDGADNTLDFVVSRRS